ncbi:MAG: hypothetical protein IPL92_19870 [Saprospiraceae bacterium]|nr:hypothetical protein [Candidatus Opimibacter iunctus]
MKNLIYISLSLSLSLLTSCASVDKMVESGDYDGAIRLATQKLAGKKKKKEEYVIALEKGFEKITRQDMASIDAWSNSNRAADWEAIIRTANNIQSRQDRIEPLLPLVSENGYQAKFTFVQTDKIISEAKDKLVSLYENRLIELVKAARAGNKASAREAYDLLNRMRSINADYVRPELKEEMRQLGINHIIVAVENNSQAFIPNSVVDELLVNDFARNNGDWNRFYLSAVDGLVPDYSIKLKIQEIYVTPDGGQERRADYSKEIVDGWEYVLDARGNVLKDSLGNDVKRDKLVRVNATVLELAQSKKALVRSRVEIVNEHTGQQICSENIEVEEIFSHVARNIIGDDRALDPNMRARIQPLPFPSESDLIRDAFRGLKPKFVNEIRNANFSY